VKRSTEGSFQLLKKYSSRAEAMAVTIGEIETVAMRRGWTCDGSSQGGVCL